MEHSELDVRIAELTGYRWVVSSVCRIRDSRCRRLLSVREGVVGEVWDGEEVIEPCDNGGLDEVPDYSGDLDATMAVIRERWPAAAVDLDFECATIWPTFDELLDYYTGPLTVTGEPWLGEESSVGDTDAERLARALLKALEAEIE